MKYEGTKTGRNEVKKTLCLCALLSLCFNKEKTKLRHRLLFFHCGYPKQLLP